MRYTPQLLFVLAFISASFNTLAQECPDTTNYEGAREIIEDLGRIVTPNGIQESFTADIGGIPQWLSIRGKDLSNPIILFVHGGPAAPVTPSHWQFQRPLEEYFTVVNWDQRGSGKTHHSVDSEIIEDTINIQQYADDAIEVAELLTDRFDNDKVILMGHSWGTIVSMHAALKRPDLFHAYVGIGQVINVRENERISFEYGLAQAKADGNQAAVDEMMTIAPYPGDKPITRDRIVTARKWAQHYGGLSAYRDNSFYYYRAPRLSPEYNDAERCAINEGNIFTLGRILPEFLEVDFSDVEEFPIPVVMFMGQHDYTTPSEPTADWLNSVDAPYKKGVWFEHSSHMVPWEEPGKTLVSLLEFVRPLATKGTVDSNKKGGSNEQPSY